MITSMRKILQLSENASARVFKYKWEAEKPDGTKYDGITTLVGPALQDVLDLHNVGNPDKLIEIWNNSAESTFKASGIRYRYTKL